MRASSIGIPQGHKTWSLAIFVWMLLPLVGSSQWIHTDSEIQRAAAAVKQWSNNSKLQLNAATCKEMVIDFKLVKASLCRIV